MDEQKVLHNKRESFRIEIRRQKLESIFGQKRPHPKPNAQLSQTYNLSIEKMNQQSLLNVLLQVNESVPSPIAEMTENNLAYQLSKYLTLKGIQEWETMKAILKYLTTFTTLPDDLLQPYLQRYSMLYQMTEFYVSVISEIENQKFTISGNDAQSSLGEGLTYRDRLSYTFIKLSWILLYSFSESQQSRCELLKSQIFVQKVYKVLQIKLDNQVLVQHLRFIASLLQQLSEQPNECQKHAIIFIYPICSAMLTPNQEKLQEILLILAPLSKVGISHGYVNLIFKSNGASSLIKLLENAQCSEDVQYLTLKNISELAYQSPAHCEILIQNHLISAIAPKLISQYKKVQYQALWVLEYVANASKACCQMIFQHPSSCVDSICLKIVDKDAQVREQACFTICSIIKHSDYDQIQILCEKRIIKSLIENLDFEFKELFITILEAFLVILNLETWKNTDSQQTFIVPEERYKIKLYLESLYTQNDSYIQEIMAML